MTMTSRRYLSLLDSAPYSPATVRGSWGVVSSSAVHGLLVYRPSAGASVNTASLSADALMRRFVSDAFPATGTISGATASWCVGVFANSTSALVLRSRVFIYVTSGDTDTPRGTLLDLASGSTTWSTADNLGRGETSQALSTLAVQAGDRLVIEFGCDYVSGSGSGRLVAGNGNPDITEGVATTTSGPASWFEFVGMESFLPGPVPTVTDSSLAQPRSLGSETFFTKPRVATFADALIPTEVEVTAAASAQWDVIGVTTSTVTARWTTLRRVGGTFGDPVASARWDVTEATGTAEVTATAGGTWATLGTVTGTAGAAWHAMVPVTGAASATWATVAPVTAGASGSWAIAGPFTSTGGGTWTVRQAVTATAGGTWGAEMALTAMASAAWDSHRFVAATASAAWQVRTPVTASAAATWTSTAAVQTNAAANWDLHTPVTGAASATWTAHHIATTAGNARWDLLNTVAATAAAAWTLRQLVDRDAAATWTVRQLPAPHVTRPAVRVTNGDRTVDVASSDRDVHVVPQLLTVGNVA